MLILAVVAIRAVQGDGIIGHAQNAKDKYGQKAEEENSTLQNYTDYITGQIGGSAGGGESNVEPITADRLNTVLSATDNAPLVDKYGNKIVVPAGFKILVDGTTDYTPDTIDVTKGIVIQDENRNEFVWVPVGTIYTNIEKTASKTIILGRYSSFTANDSGEYVPVQPTDSNLYTSEVAITSGSYTYTELQPTENGKGPNGNAIAKDIKDFYEKAIASHGYYIGRFEAGVSGYDETATNNNTKPSGETNWTKYTTADGKVPQLVCKANQQVWGNVTQNKASELCKNMYTNKPYESDLINSYAWDTAIVFIQTFGTETGASNYANANNCNGLKQTGANQKNEVPDKYRNIYDMSGNAWELSTETSSGSSYPCAIRGGGLQHRRW